MKPRYCTSYRCQNFGCDYCRDCSHAIFYGTGRDRKGKLWRFEFNPWFGPMLVNKNGTLSLRDLPKEKSNFWKVFGEWLNWFDNVEYREMWE